MTLTAWLVKVLILLILFPHASVHADNFPHLHTYGFSVVATDTRYCSAEVVRGKLDFSCQNGF
jgi:hypothetical protein